MEFHCPGFQLDFQMKEIKKVRLYGSYTAEKTHCPNQT